MQVYWGNILTVKGINREIIGFIRVEHILKEFKIFIDNKNIQTNTFKIPAYDSVCVDVLLFDLLILCLFDFMFALGKTLADFTNLFSPNSFKSNGDIILNYFMTNI